MGKYHHNILWYRPHCSPGKLKCQLYDILQMYIIIIDLISIEFEIILRLNWLKKKKKKRKKMHSTIDPFIALKTCAWLI